MKQPSPIQGLHAVVIFVKDLEKQKHFYGDILGLEVEGDYGDAIFYRCGDQKIALFEQSHHREGSKRLEGAKKGISHLEFIISKEQQEAWNEYLTLAGHHAYRENFEDADGNLFHFVFR
ncbi:VOC family protein [Rubeoparvulum massiliense]|uniref:VOC family protein n=1 Tax=Rubeoparvulum massiliense TaxID=1631346 RepID=UPI00065E8EDB|nr:VOC family protein [Rubeoparvulum massiliense]